MSRVKSEDIEKWFSENIATYQKFSDDVRMIEFKRPDSMIHGITYIIHERTLFVNGDYYAATYRWSSPISFQFLAGCHLGYFSEKCDASPEGREYLSWDEEVARKGFEEELENRIAELGLDDDKEAEKAFKEKWADEIEEARGCLSDRWEWFRFIDSYHHNEFVEAMFGDDHYGDYNIGMTVDVCCQAHLVGIRLAVAQLKEKGILKE